MAPASGSLSSGVRAQRTAVPVTPFHFGPGGLLAIATRGSVSFLAFCASNVLIDVESLYNMVTHQPRVHTFLHTYLGSTLVAAIVVVAFIPLRHLAAKLPDWQVFTLASSWTLRRRDGSTPGCLVACPARQHNAQRHHAFGSVLGCERALPSCIAACAPLVLPGRWRAGVRMVDAAL